MANGNSSVAALAGLLLAVVGPLISIIYWRQRSDIAGLRAEVKKLWAEASAFHQHRAFDTERQKHWEQWRAERETWREDLLERVTGIENKITEFRQENSDWRHKILQPRINELQLDIVRLKDKIRLE